jgi:hypothetical protein
VLKRSGGVAAENGAQTVDWAGETGLAAGAVSRFDPLAPTVFHASWWLDIASDGQWRQAEVASGGRIVGRFPYVIGRMPGGHALCGMPPITHFLGPAVDEGKGAACNRALKRAQVTRELLDQMPRASGFYHKLNREITDTLVFQERGFATSVQFTFELAPSRPDVLWRNMRDKTRNVIRRAGETAAVESCRDPVEFTAAYDRHLAQRGLRNHYDPGLLQRLCRGAMARRQGDILVARGTAGDIIAGIFCVWDATSTYYLLTTRDAEAGNGVVALLLWQAIQQSAARGLIFDFDGVGVQGSRLFFTGFGGVVRPRYIVSRYSLAHRIVGRLSNPFRRREEVSFY